MDLDHFRNHCLSKPGVTEDYPFKGEAVWMKVMGKMFAMANVKELKMEGQLVPPFHFINAKCDPERAIDLRASHAAVIPAWHQNKKHWNTILIDGSMNDSLILELVDHAYILVRDGLPKKAKDELQHMS